MPALRLAQERTAGCRPRPSARWRRRSTSPRRTARPSRASTTCSTSTPTGRHLVEVCTNVSCALVGAQQTLEAFEHELGIRAGETTPGRRVVTLRLLECAGGCGWGPVVSVDHRYREPVQTRGRACDRRGAPCRLGSSSSSTPTRPTSRSSPSTSGSAATRSSAARCRWSPTRIKEEVLASGIRGRGGAAFPMGRKMQFVPTPDQTPKPIYFVVNADESEPGTFKDREIMLRVPHLLLEGVLISSFAIGARHAFIYIRGEYLDAYEVLRAALDEAESRGLVGANVLGSGWSCQIVIHRGAGAYICGEETALLDSLEGRARQAADEAAVPGHRGPVRIADRGQQRRDGRRRCRRSWPWAARSTRRSASRTRPARASCSLSGNVVRGGNYEIELGKLTIRQLIYDPDLGGGIPDGRSLKAVIPGGSSTPILSAAEIDATCDYDAIAKAGSQFGAAAFIVIDDRCCMVQLGAALRAVLPAGVLRQVHAVPRGRPLAGRHPPTDRGGPRLAGGARPAPRRLRPDPRAVPVPARRLLGDHRRELRREVPRRVPARTSTRAAARSAASRRWPGWVAAPVDLPNAHRPRTMIEVPA